MLKYNPKLPREKVYGVYESDVLGFFSKLGLLEILKMGQIVCEKCEITITENNFGAVYKKNNELVFLCDKPQCKNVIEGIE